MKGQVARRVHPGLLQDLPITGRLCQGAFPDRFDVEQQGRNRRCCSPQADTGWRIGFKDARCCWRSTTSSSAAAATAT